MIRLIRASRFRKLGSVAISSKWNNNRPFQGSQPINEADFSVKPFAVGLLGAIGCGLCFGGADAKEEPERRNQRTPDYTYPQSDGEIGIRYFCGDMRNGVPHGFGTMYIYDPDRIYSAPNTCSSLFEGGSIYRGQFDNGVPKGKGTFISEDGELFRIGKFEGLETFTGKTYASGNLYEGTFIDGKLCGQASVATWTDGCNFTGQYSNNRLNGEALCVCQVKNPAPGKPNISQTLGVWREGLLVSGSTLQTFFTSPPMAKLYELIGGRPKLVNSVSLPSDSLQEESTTNREASSLDLRDTIVLAGSDSAFEGAIYRGELLNGRPNGRGEVIGYKQPSYRTTTYSGEFKDGVPHGEGVAKMDEVIYAGQWRAGQFHGLGRLYALDITPQSPSWFQIHSLSPRPLPPGSEEFGKFKYGELYNGYRRVRAVDSTEIEITCKEGVFTTKTVKLPTGEVMRFEWDIEETF